MDRNIVERFLFSRLLDIAPRVCLSPTNLLRGLDPPVTDQEVVEEERAAGRLPEQKGHCLSPVLGRKFTKFNVSLVSN
jgi:hypothetical protein